MEFEWKIPKWSNIIERDRARTYFQAYAAAALHFAEQALAELHAGRTKTWSEFKVPDEAIGCGLHRAAAHRNIQSVRPGMRVFEASAKTGAGMDELLPLLSARPAESEKVLAG